jgi:hypothetical protein
MGAVALDMGCSVRLGWEEGLLALELRMINKVDKGGYRRDYFPALV